MPQQTIGQALTVWREGERLLEELPPLSPDHESVALAVAEVRETYFSLTSQANVTADVLERSRETIAGARIVIAAARDRRGPELADIPPV